MKAKVWRSEMRKHLHHEPHGGKARDVKETRVESIQSVASSNSAECYVVSGPHLAHESPKWEKMAALIPEEEGDADSPSCINQLQLIGAFRTVKGNAPMPLLYVHVVVNSREINTVVDTGATHNFVCNVAVARSKLDVGKHTAA